MLDKHTTSAGEIYLHLSLSRKIAKLNCQTGKRWVGKNVQKLQNKSGKVRYVDEKENLLLCPASALQAQWITITVQSLFYRQSWLLLNNLQRVKDRKCGEMEELNFVWSKVRFFSW